MAKAIRSILVAMAAVACITICSCKADPDRGRTPLQSVGKFACFEGKTIVAISEVSPRTYTYTIEHNQVRAEPGGKPFKRGRPWFVFAETADRVWAYDGDQNVTLTEFAGKAIKTTSSHVAAEVVKQAPKEVRERLPAMMKDPGH